MGQSKKFNNVNVNQNKGLFNKEQLGCRGPIHGWISDYWSARQNLSRNKSRFLLGSVSIVKILNSQKINEEADEAWSEEQIEAWQHDCWLLRQELGEDDMIHEETDHYYEEDPFEVEQRMKWQEEEEKKQELTISK